MERENLHEGESIPDPRLALATNDLEKEFPHRTKGELRAVVARIEREMARSTESPAEIDCSTSEFHASWGKLVALLALGPAPVVRECPACRRIGMSAATRCGYCWTRLWSPPEVSTKSPS
jgi:hypothetical protein